MQQGAAAVNQVVKVVGADKAAFALMALQYATEGGVHTLLSVASNSNVIQDPIVDATKTYLYDKVFQPQSVNNTQQKSADMYLSKTLAQFGYGLVFSGSYSIIRDAGKVVEAQGVRDVVGEGESGTGNAVKITEEKPKTYQTYMKTNPETGEVYVGRTSGTGTAEENIYNRNQNHHMNEKGFDKAVLDKSSTNKDAIRGREQQLIEQNGGAKSQGGTSGNAINGISDKNPKKQQYMDAAKQEFGE